MQYWSIDNIMQTSWNVSRNANKVSSTEYITNLTKIASDFYTYMMWEG